MRVIAGSARRIQLDTPKGMDTRPTTDRIKETLFNMIAEDIPGCLFLDLFAGSGQIGIEALSRGADHAVFVERNRQTANIILQNLQRTHLKEKARVICQDAVSALKQMHPERPFSVIFMDPPYGQGFAERLLPVLSSDRLTDLNTLLIIEENTEADFSFAPSLGFTVIRKKVYKTNCHIFLKKSSTE